MALTLAQSALLTQDLLIKGVKQELLKQIPLYHKLPYVTIEGNALAFNRENTDSMGAVSFKAIGGLWTESTASFTPVTSALTVLGEDCDVDNFMQQTRSNKTDQMAQQVKIKTKLMGHAYENQGYYGVAATSSGPDGLHTLCATAQKVTTAVSATAAAGTLHKLDEAIDLVTAGTPEALVMSKQTRRNLTQYMRVVGSYTTERDDYGKLWEMYRPGLPIVVSDKLRDDELCTSSGIFTSLGGAGASSSIFVVLFGEDIGLVGLQNGDIQTEVWEKLESKDASRTRLKWYCGLALYSTKALSVLSNISNAVWTA